MKYRNTRGGCSSISFEQTLFVGWHSNGGLLVPEHIPLLSREDLLSWKHHSYHQIALNMFHLFTDEAFMSTYDLKSVFKKAHASFPQGDVIPLKRIDQSVYVLELFHGPTHSFKDVALSVAGPLLNLVLKHHRKHGLVYVATSGDTGSAVINATKDASHLDTVTFLPGGNRITELQRKLMTTVRSANVHNFSGDCCCDEFDMFLPDLVSRLHEKRPDLVVTSLNSLAWIRIPVQTCHVIYTYLQLGGNFEEEVTFVIPTGGGGHITSALLAKKMGLPIRIVSAFNEKNLNFKTFLEGGELRYNLPVTRSLCCAMDIQMPTAVDRLLYLLSDMDIQYVKEKMDAYEAGGAITATGRVLDNLKASIATYVATDDDIVTTMQCCWNSKKYVMGPHTASGFTRYEQLFKSCDNDEVVVYMGCASPIKFSETLNLAGVPLPDSYQKYCNELNDMEENVNPLPSSRGEWMSYLMKYIDDNIPPKTMLQ